ncbi:MAG: Sec-independent protein translocase protein TatB [Helicobacter sp.]|nr:Sec-independent protein translocase protein TatB [Helicobacter sp.]
MGFMEILLIAVVAIVALGPEKLPQAMIDAAKFIRAFKKTIDDAKQSITKEMQLHELKDGVLSLKNEVHAVNENIREVTQINLDKLADLELDDDDNKGATEPAAPAAKPQTPQPQSPSEQPKAPIAPIVKAQQVAVGDAPQSVGFGAFKNPSGETRDKDGGNV